MCEIKNWGEGLIFLVNPSWVIFFVVVVEGFVIVCDCLGSSNNVNLYIRLIFIFLLFNIVLVLELY